VTDTLSETELLVELMSVELLRPDPDNPRDTLGELAELTDSIESIGVLQPLIVTPTGEIGAEDQEIMMVVAGHRRLAAALLAERTHVPVIVRSDIDEEGRRAAQFIENFHRLDLGPIERARALKQLADTGMAQKDIGEKVGITQGTVSKWLALLKLPVKAQKWVADGSLTQEDAVAMAALPKETIAELCGGEEPPDDLDIHHAKHLIEVEKKHAAAVKAAQAKGWRILEDDPEYFQQLGLEGDDKPVSLDDDRESPYGLLAHVDPTEHESEPCHAVFIDDGEVTSACTNPSAHPMPEGWKSPFQLRVAEQQAEAASAARAQPRKKLAEQGKIPAPRRGEFIREQVVAKVEPVRATCRRLLSERVDPESVVDFGVLAMLQDEDWDPRRIGELLGLQLPPFNTDGLVEAITGDGAITGLKVLHAWGLASGLSALEELAQVTIGHSPVEFNEDDDWFVADARKLLEHLAGFEFNSEDALTFEQFVASCSSTSDEEAREEVADGPTVEVYEQKGKFKRRCSECGDLDGQNTKEELAQGRAADHLRDVHKIELAEAGAA
jgi:ParB/RepB/Spo0J family partition protein